MREGLANTIAGAFCGLTVDSITFPLDTLKTRFQAQKGSVTVGKHQNLFKGLGTILIGSIPASAIYWSIYEKTKRRLHESAGEKTRLYPLCEMIAATIGESVASAVRNPFEVTKQFIQVRGYSNPLKAILAISKERGFRAFYSGYGPMLMRDIPFDMIEYSLYEAEKRWCQKHMKRDLYLYESMLMGCVAGGIAAFLTCPLDVLKTRIMLTADLPASQRMGVMSTLKNLIQEEGYGRLFAGVKYRVMWISFGGAIWFGAFEEYKRFFHQFV